jgi:hypothetical protein
MYFPRIAIKGKLFKLHPKTILSTVNPLNVYNKHFFDLYQQVVFVYSRGLKLKLSRGLHETESNVWWATLNIFELISNVLRKQTNWPNISFKISIFLMFAGLVFETAGLEHVQYKTSKLGSVLVGLGFYF